MNRSPSAAQTSPRTAANIPASAAPNWMPAAAPAQAGDGAVEAELSVVVVLGYN